MNKVFSSTIKYDIIKCEKKTNIKYENKILNLVLSYCHKTVD